MNPARWVAGLATLLTAMLLQATLIGPLLYPLPASLPLVAIAAIALMSGPSTGITVGFAAGLLADLGSRHAIGVLALVWLGVGLAAGILGGMVMTAHPTRLRRPARRRRPHLGGRPTVARRPAPAPVSRRRAQALLVGLLGGLGALATALVLQVIGDGGGSLGPAAIRCAPAGVLDAILALAVLPVIDAALRSGSLRAPAAVPPTRSSPRSMADVW